MGVIMLWAGAAKLLHLKDFLNHLGEFTFMRGSGMEVAVAVSVIACELLLAHRLLGANPGRCDWLLSITLLVVFACYQIVIAQQVGWLNSPEHICPCFAASGQSPPAPQIFYVLRALVLMALSGLGLWLSLKRDSDMESSAATG
jgi:predicted ABC-type sugar transport system permease subunit